MDPLGILVEATKPPWRYALAALALLLFIAPKLVDFRASWMDLRLGRRTLDLERQRLELLKLRYEIEGLRRQYDLSPADVLPPAPAGAPTLPTLPSIIPELPPPAPPAIEDEPGQKWGILRWLGRHPTLGKPTSWLLQIVFALLTAMLVLTTVMTPFITASDDALDFWTGLIVAVVYGLLAWGAWKAFLGLRRWRRSTWWVAAGGTARPEAPGASLPEEP